jgi:hypothetical protein
MVDNSWIGFRLDNIMNSFMALSVGSNGTVRHTYRSGQMLIFNSVFVDTHSAWNVTNSDYKVPVTGYYFVSLQLASNSRCQLDTNLIVYDRYQYLAHARYYYGFGTQTLSTSLLIFVQEEKFVDVNFYDLCGPLYSNETVRATLSLFLYQPIVGSRIAWTASTECSHDPANPLQFNFISVNEGSGFIVKPPYE